MQTESLNGTRSSWPRWAEFLHRNGLDVLASWMLEALAPVNVLTSQVLHAGAPFLRPALSGPQVSALSTLLEDPAESRAFAAYLRKEGSP